MSLFTKAAKRQVLDLPVAEIRPNPRQPRRDFPPGELAELALSISQVGVLQPLTVRRTPGGWELIAGERRLRAAQLAGLLRVPCLPMEADSDASALLALVENLQRQDLTVWEEAAALRQLIDRHHLSQEEAAQRVGKSQSAVANKLRLLKLPEDVIATLRSHRLTERHARSLLRLGSPEAQRAALEEILKRGLNVAQTEVYIDRLLQSGTAPRKAAPVYRIRDVRLFLNTVKRSLAVMQSAGVNARCGKEETDREITLTIHIPK
ncbi:MAG: ParB/RepB/Spo0J family partition protein [Oscillospiraceae bacterium]|jgi:ParB family chromosome partitioning protein|nr:ParB/RepB/Spo0J family partition protein [Oscillospiraceae bacterium]